MPQRQPLHPVRRVEAERDRYPAAMIVPDHRGTCDAERVGVAVAILRRANNPVVRRFAAETARRLADMPGMAVRDAGRRPAPA